MALRIIKKEPYVLEVQGSKVFLREIPAEIYQQFYMESLIRGKLGTDPKILMDKITKYIVTGWEGVEDSDGNPVKFSIDKLKLISSFFGYIKIFNKIEEIITKTMEGMEKEVTQQKNLPSTSSLPASTEKTSPSTSVTDAASNAGLGVQKKEESHPVTIPNKSRAKDSKNKQKKKV